MTSNHDRRYFDMNGAAAYLQVSRRSVAGWKARGLLPFAQLGRRILFDIRDLDAFVRERRIDPTGGDA